MAQITSAQVITRAKVLSIGYEENTHLQVRQLGNILDVVLSQIELLQSMTVLEIGQCVDLVDAEREEVEKKGVELLINIINRLRQLMHSFVLEFLISNADYL